MEMQLRVEEIRNYIVKSMKEDRILGRMLQRYPRGKIDKQKWEDFYLDKVLIHPQIIQERRDLRKKKKICGISPIRENDDHCCG